MSTIKKFFSALIESPDGSSFTLESSLAWNKTLRGLALTPLLFLPLFLFSPVAHAFDGPHFNYICSVYQKNKDGLFKDVVNVVFLPDHQKKSHLYHDRGLDIWFEVTPILDFKGEPESYEMQLRLLPYSTSTSNPLFQIHGPEFSEIAFESEEHNIGARCFHRTQRGYPAVKGATLENPPL